MVDACVDRFTISTIKMSTFHPFVPVYTKDTVFIFGYDDEKARDMTLEQIQQQYELWTIEMKGSNPNERFKNQPLMWKLALDRKKQGKAPPICWHDMTQEEKDAIYSDYMHLLQSHACT